MFGDSLSSKGFHVYLLSIIEPAQTELRGKRVLLHGVKVTKHLDEHRPPSGYAADLSRFFS